MIDDPMREPYIATIVLMGSSDVQDCFTCLLCYDMTSCWAEEG